MGWFGADEPRDRVPLFQPESAVRLAPFVLTLFFGIVFAVIADLVWLTAVKTTSPWYTSTISSQMYAGTLTAGSVGALILVSIAAGRLGRLNPLRWLPSSPGGPFASRSAVPVDRDPGMSPPPTGRAIVPEGFEQIIADLEKLTEVSQRTPIETGRGTAVQVALTRPRAAPQPTEMGVAPPAADPEWARTQRATIWQTIAGPLAMFVVFVAIGGAMLPGSGAFAMVNYQLNTGLVLFLGYGWPFLVAWTVMALLLLNPPGRDRTTPSTGDVEPSGR